MPATIYAYMLREIGRVVLLTTAVLVSVIAMGATIKPLAGDDLLGPTQVLKYMAFVVVPMLQFALPFAAGFGGTLVLHRLTAENEILAMAASGLGFRRIIAPVAALGLVLTLLMIGLTQSVIPRFWGLLGETVATDVTRLLQASVRRGTPFRFGTWSIYAEFIEVVEDTEQTGADRRMRLWKVAAADIDVEGRVRADVTATHAVIDVYRREAGTFLKIAFRDTVVYSAASGTLVDAPEIEPRAIPLPLAIDDDPVAMTRGRLRAVLEEPDRFPKVARANRDLAARLRDQAQAQAIDAALQAEGRLELTGVGDRRYVVQADRLSRGELSRHGGRPVVVHLHDRGALALTWRAREAWLERGGSDLGEAFFRLLLRDVTVVDTAPGTVPTEKDEQEIRALRVAGFDVGPIEDERSAALLARAAAVPEPSAALERAIERVVDEREDIRLEARSRLVRRYALSATAMLLLLVGSAMAIQLRGRTPLTTYLWAFLPAVVDLILISGGDHLVRDGNVAAGMVVMWSGNALLLAIFVAIGVRLERVF